MSRVARWWVFGAGGLLLWPAAAWLCSRSLAWLLLFGPLLGAWSLWVVIEYMLWYKTWSKPQGRGSVPSPRGGTRRDG